MATVLVEYQIRVVDDGLIKQLYKKTMETGNDLAEIPELPGVCLHEIIDITKGGEILNISGLKDRIDGATYGDTPTAIMLVRKGDTIREGGKK